MAPATPEPTPVQPEPAVPETPEVEEPKVEEAKEESPLKGMSEEEFIAYIGEKAKADMETTGILASVTIAQAILESGWGQSELALNANNLFGMKASLSGNTWASDWKGNKYSKETKEEYTVGEITPVTADFRAYDSIDESIKDHSDYLRGAKNGSVLRYEGLVGITDYKAAIQLIKDGGYATDSKYVDKVCNIIETYKLTEFDGVKDDDEETPEVPETPEVEEPKVETPEFEEPENSANDEITDDEINDAEEKLNGFAAFINALLKIINVILSVFKSKK